MCLQTLYTEELLLHCCSYVAVCLRSASEISLWAPLFERNNITFFLYPCVSGGTRSINRGKIWWPRVKQPFNTGQCKKWELNCISIALIVKITYFTVILCKYPFGSVLYIYTVCRKAPPAVPSVMSHTLLTCYKNCSAILHFKSSINCVLDFIFTALSIWIVLWPANYINTTTDSTVENKSTSA